MKNLVDLQALSYFKQKLEETLVKIDDSSSAEDKTLSAKKIKELISQIDTTGGGSGVIIDDDATEGTNTVWSVEKTKEYINTIIKVLTQDAPEELNTFKEIADALDNKVDKEDGKGLFSGNYADLTGTPTNVSEFTNDAGYLTTDTANYIPIPEAASTKSKILTTNAEGNLVWDDGIGIVTEDDINGLFE